MRQTLYFDEFAGNKRFWPGEYVRGTKERAHEIPHSATWSYTMAVVARTFPLVLTTIIDGTVINHRNSNDIELFLPVQDESNRFRKNMDNVFTQCNSTGAIHNTSSILKEYDHTGDLYRPPVKLLTPFHPYRDTSDELYLRTESSEKHDRHIRIRVEQVLLLQKLMPPLMVLGTMHLLNYDRLHLFISSDDQVRRDNGDIGQYALLFQEGKIYGHYVDLEEAKKIVNEPYE